MSELTGIRPATYDVLVELAIERDRQLAKHGDQRHLCDGTGPEARLLPSRFTAAEWATVARSRVDTKAQDNGGPGPSMAEVLLEEVAEAMAEADPTALRAELIQVAAFAVQWVEYLDARLAIGSQED